MDDLTTLSAVAQKRTAGETQSREQEQNHADMFHVTHGSIIRHLTVTRNTSKINDMRQKLNIEEPPENKPVDMRKIVDRVKEWANLSETEPVVDEMYAG